MSPAGTIFFGEVAIRNTIDARASVYNVNFDGTTTTRAFVPTLIIGSRMDTADIALEDGTLPSCVLELELNGSVGSGAVAGVYTFEPVASGHSNTGLKITLQATSSTAYSNLQIINRGTDYDVGDIVNVTREQVGGSGSTTFVSFKVKRVGSPLETSNNLTFTGDLGKVELETGEGIMTTERFLAVTSTTVRDQASGTLYTSVPDQPPGAQSYIVGDTFTPTTRDFFNRQLILELSPKGHRVHKELDIFPTYNQHKIYYTTLTNALAVGTKVRGATSNALGIVIKHDTTRNNAILRYTSAVSGTGVVGTYFNVTGVSSASGSAATFDIILDTTTSVSSILIRNTGSGFVPNETITIQEKHVGGAWNDTDTFAVLTVSKVDSDYIIVHRDSKDWGKAGSQFSGTEIIQNTGASTNYFTATSIELHWTPEDIVTKREPTTITADQTLLTSGQETATEGGGESYAHADYLGNLGFHGRGKVLVAADHSETYDSEMRQRKVNLISSPLFSQGVTQRGRTFSAGLKQARTPLNQKGARTEGTNTIVAGDTSPPYLAITGTALRIDDIKNSVTSIPGDSSTTVRVTTDGVSRTGVDLHGGQNWGYRPAGQKLYDTTNFISERLVSEANDTFVMEDDHGRVMGEYFGQGGIVLLEDDTTLLWETATIVDETHYFVSEESTQVDSYNFISESGERIIDETLSNPFILEEALMAGQKESSQSGPSIGDLRNIVFSENYAIMSKIREENF